MTQLQLYAQCLYRIWHKNVHQWVLVGSKYRISYLNKTKNQTKSSSSKSIYFGILVYSQDYKRATRLYLETQVDPFGEDSEQALCSLPFSIHKTLLLVLLNNTYQICLIKNLNNPNYLRCINSCYLTQVYYVICSIKICDNIKHISGIVLIPPYAQGRI